MSVTRSTQATPLPGRLGTPDMTLRTEPRADPRMVAALQPFGLCENDIPGQLTKDSPLEAQLAHVLDVVEPGNDALFDGLLAHLPAVEGVEHSTETIRGPDGNELTLHISRPAGATGPLPGVLEIHGGAMVFLQATGSMYTRFRDELAAAGAVVVGVEYRTAGGVQGSHPFPAGLEDCAAALAWMHERRQELGVTSLVLTGDSGGANLALATALKAKRDGRVHSIDGVYAMMPYVSGAAGWDPETRARELPSWAETGGYFFCAENVELLVNLYDPGRAHARDALAWPYFASGEDLEGLPPHVISVAELDPVRDEGLAYYRKLVHAGVNARAITLHGVCHVGDMMFRAELPELYAATIANVKRFAERVAHAG